MESYYTARLICVKHYCPSKALGRISLWKNGDKEELSLTRDALRGKRDARCPPIGTANVLVCLRHSLCCLCFPRFL